VEPGRYTTLLDPLSSGNIRIRNKQENETGRIERITQNHPIVRFISAWLSKEGIKPHPLISAKIPLSALNRNRAPSVTQGIYFFFISCWTTEGIGRKKFSLEYRMIRLDDEENIPRLEAEHLVNLTSYQGEDWTPLTVKAAVESDRAVEAYSILETELEEEFGLYREEQKQSNDADAAYQKRQFTAELRVLEKKYRETREGWYIGEAQGLKGRLRALENRFRKKEAAIQEKLARIEKQQERFKVTAEQLCCGLIKVY
jgi:hypothetical protein